MKVRVLIYGTGSSARVLYNILDFKKLEIVAFIESEPKEETLYLNKKFKVFSPEEIKKVDFNYILIASMYFEEIKLILEALGIKKEKIICFDNAFLSSITHEFSLKTDLYDVKINEEEIELIATGLSYTRDGIDLSALDVNGANFAFSSQDLYSDYYILDYLFNKYKLNNLKFIIIGIGYFSFNYDLSKSVNSHLTPRYYGITKSMRSYQINSQYYKCRNFIFEFGDYCKISSLFDSIGNKNYYKTLTESDKKEGESTALRHTMKNYPDTIKENKNYFEKILNLCKVKRVQPIILVFPTTKYYYSHLTEEFENNFLEIIKEMQQKYKFLFLNLIKSPNYNDDDFWDASHLNYKGAKKITNKINEVISEGKNDFQKQ